MSLRSVVFGSVKDRSVVEPHAESLHWLNITFVKRPHVASFGVADLIDQDVDVVPLPYEFGGSLSN